MAQKPHILPSILGMKCPNCRKGHMFEKKSIFPLGKLLAMPDHCSECGQKMEIEVGFYYGTGYVSYGICVALCVFNFLWYYLLIGITWKDNSIYHYLIANIAIIVFLQPWIMRYSRVLYLYMFVKYQQNKYISKDFVKK